MVWQPFDLIDILIFVLAIVILVYTLYEIHKKPSSWIKFIPLIFWATHLACFYGVIIAGNLAGKPLSHEVELIWSTVQRLHGVITVFYMVWLMSNSSFIAGKNNG